jgi:hypothetical protein
VVTRNQEPGTRVERPPPRLAAAAPRLAGCLAQLLEELADALARRVDVIAEQRRPRTKAGETVRKDLRLVLVDDPDQFGRDREPQRLARLKEATERDDGCAGEKEQRRHYRRLPPRERDQQT